LNLCTHTLKKVAPPLVTTF